LKRERWGSPLVQEKYREEQACDKRHPYRIIIIIIIIITIIIRIITNVEPEIYHCTSNNWSHWNSNEKLKKKFGNCIRKTFDRLTTKHSYTWNITHNTESTAV